MDFDRGQHPIWWDDDLCRRIHDRSGGTTGSICGRRHRQRTFGVDPERSVTICRMINGSGPSLLPAVMAP